MKTLTTSALALAAIAILGACDSHSWESTKPLHEKPAIKSGEHGEGHGAESHGEGHAAPAAEHK
jgi:hypothetical protein